MDLQNNLLYPPRMSQKKSETLDQAEKRIKEQHIEPILEKVEVLEEFKNDFEKNFDKKVLNSLEQNVGVRKEVKVIVWQTMKDKIVWIILGAAITLGIAFAQGYMSELGKNVFMMQKPAMTQQAN